MTLTTSSTSFPAPLRYITSTSISSRHLRQRIASHSSHIQRLHFPSCAYQPFRFPAIFCILQHRIAHRFHSIARDTVSPLRSAQAFPNRLCEHAADIAALVLPRYNLNPNWTQRCRIHQKAGSRLRLLESRPSRRQHHPAIAMSVTSRHMCSQKHISCQKGPPCLQRSPKIHR